MDPMGGFPNEEWESFERMFSSNESLAITMQLEGDSPPHFEDLGYEIETPSIFWPPQEPNLTNIIGSFQNDVHFSALIGCNHIPIQNSDNPVPMDYCMAGEKNGVSLAPFSANEMMEVAVCLNGEMGSDEYDRKLGEHHSEAIGILGKRKIDDGPLELHQIEVAAKISPTSPQSPNKRPKVTKDVRKSKKSVKNKRNHQKKATTNSSGEEVTNNNGEESNGQSTSSCCSSEDDSNASENSKGSTSASTTVALNLNGKPRATKGAATDPQSLYARKRRERINERLKILQNLVPNGTKVDISTMLEDAVHYVKFLQLQIKLLSSDDLRMYAPIAYNGMDSGLNQKLSSLFKM